MPRPNGILVVIFILFTAFSHLSCLCRVYESSYFDLNSLRGYAKIFRPSAIIFMLLCEFLMNSRTNIDFFI